MARLLSYYNLIRRPEADRNASASVQDAACADRAVGKAFPLECDAFGAFIEEHALHVVPAGLNHLCGLVHHLFHTDSVHLPEGGVDDTTRVGVDHNDGYLCVFRL